MSIAVQPPYSPSIFSSSNRQELNQQVPSSPYLAGRPHNKALSATKPTHSPVARVPEIASPLLRRLLRGQKRPSSSPPPRNHKKPCEVPDWEDAVPSPNEQVVPGTCSSSSTSSEDCRRHLPKTIKQGTKPLDLFQGMDIFATREE